MRAITSFRDPAGQLTVGADRVVRRVRKGAVATLERLLELPTWKSLVAEGHVIATVRLADGAGGTVRETVAFAHPAVPFLSYPFEWPRQMLIAAGALTLYLAQRIGTEGRTLKDATPFNIAFLGSRAIFLDVLSIEEQAPEAMQWKAFGQFMRMFLLPLLYARDFGVPPAISLFHNRDGLPPESLYPLYSPLARMTRERWSLVTLPTVLGRFNRARAPHDSRAKGVDASEKAAFVRSHIFRTLHRRLRSLTPRNPRSRWSGYDTGTHTPDYRQHKQEVVSRYLTEANSSTVLDVGCNEGALSIIAARAGARVVAIDSDEAVVNALYLSVVREKLDILPMVVDLANPTPSSGWENGETYSFLERATGHFDMVFAISVIHHLLVTHGIPLPAILDTIRTLTVRHAIVEFVSPHDAMFRQLARGRDALYADLSRSTFVSALEGRFAVIASESLRDSNREIFLLRRLP